MNRVWLFLVSAGKWSVTLMTGGIVSFSLAAYEHLSKRSILPVPWILVGVILFMTGAFLAWNDQYEQAIAARKAADADRPRLTLRFITPALQWSSNYFCTVLNLGKRPAFDVEVLIPGRGDYTPICNRLQFVAGVSEMSLICNVQHKGELHNPASKDGTFFRDMLRYDYACPSDPSDIWMPVTISFSDNGHKRINRLKIQVTRPEMFINVGEQDN